MNELREMIADAFKAVFKAVGCLMMIAFILGAGIFAFLGYGVGVQEVDSSKTDIENVEEENLPPPVEEEPQDSIGEKTTSKFDFKPSQKYEFLVTEDDEVYYNILISRVYDGKISFMHDTGVRGIEISKIKSVVVKD